MTCWMVPSRTALHKDVGVSSFPKNKYILSMYILYVCIIYIYIEPIYVESTCLYRAPAVYYTWYMLMPAPGKELGWSSRSLFIGGSFVEDNGATCRLRAVSR